MLGLDQNEYQDLDLNRPKRARLALKLPDLPSGNSGNLTINAILLNVIERGVISVDNQGTGNSGLLSINVAQLNLIEAASITAEAATGKYGKIALTVSELQNRDSSKIIPEVQSS